MKFYKEYKGKKIIKETEKYYSEIRDYEGHSSRGTGTYESSYHSYYRIKGTSKTFGSMKDAQFYIDNIKYKKQVKKMYDKLKSKSKTLKKELDLNERAISKLENRYYLILDI